jgi:hypothetical protein
MQSPTLDRIRDFGVQNRIAYERLLEALLAQTNIADEALEAARRAIRESDRFEIAGPDDRTFPP